MTFCPILKTSTFSLPVKAIGETSDFPACLTISKSTTTKTSPCFTLSPFLIFVSKPSPSKSTVSIPI